MLLPIILIFIFLALLLSALTAKWYFRFKFSKFGQMVNKIPGPKPLPLLGNAVDFAGDCDFMLHTLLEKWPEMYGEIYRFFIGSRSVVVLSAPELAESVLSSKTHIDKGHSYDYFVPWLGRGLLTSSGAKWQSRRKMLTPAFHFHILEDFFEAFNGQSAILCRKIETLCSLNGKIEINVGRLTSLCTLDIICETAMGCKVYAQTKDSKYVNAMHRMMPLLMQKAFIPWHQIKAIYWLTKKGREYFRSLKIILDFTDQIVKERRKEFQFPAVGIDDCGVKKKRPFLDLLLQVSTNGTTLTDEEINEEVNTFMFEGHDTTALTLNWFLYCMAANPTHQERVWEELDLVFGDSDRPCTRQDLTELKYLECCIKETLRLYPSVPMFSRYLNQPIDLGNYAIPAGNLSIVISAYAMHRNPRIYPDPLVFDPERFTLENSVGRHPYAFVPFSAGPRNCIGQKFAMAEEKVVLSSLLRRFKFELPVVAALPRPSIEMTLKSSTGFHLIVSRR